jgi:RimJ/RimL family protein N-acetyltransferase
VTLPIHTRRLVVREFEDDDVADLARAFADPAVIWWEPAPFTLDRAREWVARAREGYAADGMGLYAVTTRGDGRLIGDCGLVPRVIAGTRVTEIGWHLARSAWGCGYATEAAHGVLTHAAELGLGSVRALIVPDNVRSRRVAARLGMAVDREAEWAGRGHDLWVADLAGRPGPAATAVLP